MWSNQQREIIAWSKFIKLLLCSLIPHFNYTFCWWTWNKKFVVSQMCNVWYILLMRSHQSPVLLCFKIKKRYRAVNETAHNSFRVKINWSPRHGNSCWCFWKYTRELRLEDSNRVVNSTCNAKFIVRGYTHCSDTSTHN